MAFLLGPLISGIASLIGSKLSGAEAGLRNPKKKGNLILTHEGEIILNKKLAKKVAKHKDFKNEIKKLPTKPAPLTKKDKSNLKTMIKKM